MSRFVHLHCHSGWSLLDGAAHAEELAAAAARRGFEALALTDHDSLLGAARFTRACREVGVRPLLGAELTLDDGAHLTVLARDRKGYGNLCRLISESHLKNERGSPRLALERVLELSEGLFVLTGCRRGRVARLAAAGRADEAVAEVRRLRDALGGALRVEVFDHRGPGDRALRDRLLRVAKDAGVPAVVTNDVHYCSPRGAAVHEVLGAIRRTVPLSDGHAQRRTAELHLKDPGEMEDLFWDAPEALEESVRVAEECGFELDLGSRHFPRLPLPPGERAEALLARRCRVGLERRHGRVTREVGDRLEHELRAISGLGFAPYFLMVADIVAHVRDVLGVRTACRGSAAGSLVCYALGISDVDPVRYDLLFERFVNARRDELPDIDIDVESHRRDEVLAYILETFGPDQTAMCCMVDTFRARLAIREVGKALGLPPGEIDVVAKAFPRIAARDIPAALERLPELRSTNLSRGQLTRLFELCVALDGLPRHLALHPSGVVLSSPDLPRRVPAQQSFGGFTMLQADKDDVEDLGLVKLDVLGVRMLSAISHAVGEIKRVRGVELDVESLPHDDDRTFELIRSSRTLGCFQIESPGQRELLARFAPARFEDLIVDISLFRPGPVKSDMVTPFLQRRHGFEPPVYAHDSLRPILRETHGVIVYHEQLIRVIAAVTGCSLDDADYVRRHLDDERPRAPGDPGSRPARHRGEGCDYERWFVQRAVANGFKADQARALWREVYGFASFGFCKSHAAAFALPTYISAYLKAHYPAEFLAGVLTHEPGMYPRRMIVADARSFGVRILPLDVNRSGRHYEVEPVGEKGGIRMALSDVRDISDAEIDSLLAARAVRPFTSLEDLWRRAGLSAPVLENLVHAGALDSVEPRRSRRELLWRARELCAAQRRARRLPGRPRQLAFDFDGPGPAALPGLPDYSAPERIEAELEVTGVDARSHLIEVYWPLLAELATVPAARLGRCPNGAKVWVAGVKVASQTPAIRSGQRIIFLTLDDSTGPVDVTVFERVQPRCAYTVFHGWLLAVRGTVRKRGGASLLHATDPRNVGVTVVAEEVFDLAELAADRRAGRSLAAALGRQRRRQVAALPASGGRVPSPRRLWHSSGGSAGG